MPGHAVNILSSGGVQPHFSRSRFNVLDDLRPMFVACRNLSARKVRPPSQISTAPKPRCLRQYHTRSQEKSPLHLSIAHRYQPRRIQSQGRGQHSGRRPQYLLGTRLQRSHRGVVGRGGPRPELPVDELVLNFVDESLGDPFRQFRILSAPFQKGSQPRGERNSLSPRRRHQRLQRGPAGILFPARPIQGRPQLDWGNRPGNPHYSNRFQIRPTQIDFRGGMVCSEPGGSGRRCPLY